jgi:peptide/nickel transport system ATP-binding protein
MLNATGITHRFGEAAVLDGIALTLAPGEIVGLAGPSGAGKSTLGRILAGHLVPTAGRVEADGEPVMHRSGRPCPVQYAPQLPELSVDPRWRVDRILRNGGPPDPEALRVLGVRPEWDGRFPAELSGGELARVSLARLLLPSTRFLVCDEITAPLDALAADAVMTSLARLAERGPGIVLIGHDTGLMRRYAHRLFVLSGGSLTPPVRGGAGADGRGPRPISTS